MPSDDFTIVARWCEPGEGWQKIEASLSGTLEQAARHARDTAQKMDNLHANRNTWTVDLYCDAHPEHGSYQQLFHGRLW